MIVKDFEGKINLTNDGTLSVFFIGTGSAFSKKFFQTNLLIIKGQDHILVDCGSLFPFAFQEAYNTNISEIENIVLTHPHADHIGGVEELILNGRYVKKSKVNIVITDEFKEKLWNESLRGGVQYSEDGEMSFDDYFVQLKPQQITENPVVEYEINIGSINLKLYRTYHVTTKDNSFDDSQYSTGIIIDDRVLFTGDSQYQPEQLKWILEHHNIECIYHDCDVGGYAEGVHASYRQLKEFPADIKKKMFLCHYNGAACTVDSKADGFAGFARRGKYYIFN